MSLQRGLTDCAPVPFGAFIQLIEFDADGLDSWETIVERWAQTIGSERTARWWLLGADRDHSDRCTAVVAFPDYPAAMINSSHPATAKFIADLTSVCIEPPTFRNLDVCAAHCYSTADNAAAVTEPHTPDMTAHVASSSSNVDVDVDAEQVARAVLLDLEERLASKNHQAIVEAYTDDAVLIADDGEHYTRAAIVEYLEQCAVMEPIIRWRWDEIAATAYGSSVVGFAASATMSFYSPAGGLLAEPEPFRMSCVVTDGDAGWKITQYHGSRPVR